MRDRFENELATLTGQELAAEVVRAAEEVKGEDPQILELKGLSSIADYFVIVHGRSDRQVQAIANRIIAELDEQNIDPLGLEGYEAGHWILIDFGDVVVHVFYEETRQFYDLEGLWSDAPRMMLPQQQNGAKT